MRNKLLSMVMFFAISLGVMMMLVLPVAQAFEINTGSSDFKLRWDNTIKYSTAYRVESQSPELIDSAYNSSNDNQDDGDRNFDRGFVSNRVDLLSEFDAVYKDFGLRASGAAWYDTIYNTTNDNDSPLTANPQSVPYNEFTKGTEELHGKKAELLDAFVFGKFDYGSTTTTFRAGQFAQQWGESLFFGNNGIAGGMAPMDIVKLLSVPNSQFKEIIRPVPQASAQMQIGWRVAIGAYYQFGWEESVLPGSGSYFSNSDIIGEGAEAIIEPADPMHNMYRIDDLEGDDQGQWGLQLLLRDIATLDLGLYAIRYHDKTPQLYILPMDGAYRWAYPENIEAYGLSASRTIGVWNLAGEVSMRRNMPLTSAASVLLPAFGVTYDNDNNPGYAVGKTWHANFSWIASFGPSFISKEAMFMGEVAWNRLDSIDKNPEQLNPNCDRDAVGIRMIYTPTYRQVMPGLDLSIPVGLSYFPKGKSSMVSSFGPDQGGDMSIGINGEYLGVWIIGLRYTHYYGDEEGYTDENLFASMKQSLADRDFIAFSISRTF